MKSDNETAVKAFKVAVGKLLGGRVILENAPTEERQAIGRMNEAETSINGFVRVMKDQVIKTAF